MTLSISGPAQTLALNCMLVSTASTAPEAMVGMLRFMKATMELNGTQ
nr:MAG TPA: hypothetical protein [Caudoviricetes sp.]